jgi:hypothetical protein
MQSGSFAVARRGATCCHMIGTIASHVRCLIGTQYGCPTLDIYREDRTRFRKEKHLLADHSIHVYCNTCFGA